MAGTVKVPRLEPSGAKYCIVVGPATSTSLNTTPKALVSAGVSVPATTNRVSITLDPIEVNKRWGENGWNSPR